MQFHAFGCTNLWLLKVSWSALSQSYSNRSILGSFVIRIAVIEPAGRLYGSEFCLLDIMSGLPRTEFDWRVFLPAGLGFDKLLHSIDIPCEFLIPATLGNLPKFKKALVYLRLMNRLRQLRPDLLYINQAGSLRVGAMYAKWLKLPVVCQVQTLEDARFVSRRPDLQNHVYAFICNSEFIAGQTNVAPHKKCVLYQGLQPARAENAKKNAERLLARPIINADNCTFGILGRIAVSKGHYLLLDAIKKLAMRLPQSRFYVVGEGLTPTDTKAFQNAVEDAGLANRFVFRGYQSNIKKELSSIDVLLIPSIAEPLGRVLFDAAEFGVPVVISEGGGLGEIGRRFAIGVSFTTADSAALADAMVDLAENFEMHRRNFAKAAVAMMQRLKMDSYLTVVSRILKAGTERQCSAMVWQGDD